MWIMKNLIKIIIMFLDEKWEKNDLIVKFVLYWKMLVFCVLEIYFWNFNFFKFVIIY